jgi:nucleotide-binding universal stress UspA family protein
LGEILVAVDGTENSSQILTASKKLANKLSYKVVLIYVSKSSDLVGEYVEIGGSSPSPGSLQYVQRAEEVTSVLAEQLHNEGIQYDVLLESGDPAKTIVEKAAERKVEMVVVGLKRLHGIEKVRSLGSVARKVIENAPCPVLVVGE